VRRAVWLFAIVIVADAAVPAAASTQGVVIENFSYAPPTITIRAGDAVSFLNKDPFAHTAAGDHGEFDTSPNCDAQHTEDESCLKPGAPVEVTFQTAGTIAYHCKIHPSMHGTIEVQPVDATTTSTATSTSTTSTSTSTTSTTTSTTDTTTTTTDTTTTTTSTTLASGSGAVGISGSSDGGGSNAVPLLIGAIVVIAAIAGLAYWRWSQTRYGEDDDGFWLDEPPTTQGPRV
jgi:plastocyanin